MEEEMAAETESHEIFEQLKNHRSTLHCQPVFVKTLRLFGIAEKCWTELAEAMQRQDTF